MYVKASDDEVESKQQAGFTLLEVMIASSILALMFAGFMIGFVQSTRLQYMSDRNYCAAVIARNRLEYCRVYAFGSLSTLAETSTCVDREGELCSTGEFWRTTSLQVSPNNNDCLEVVVQVWFQTKPGITSDAPVEVRTMIGG